MDKIKHDSYEEQIERIKNNKKIHKIDYAKKKEYYEQYYQEHKEIICKQSREYHKNHRDERREYSRRYRKEHPKSQRVRNTKQNINKRLELLTKLSNGDIKCSNPNCLVPDGCRDIRCLQIESYKWRRK